MGYPSFGVKVEFFESKSILKLKEEVNKFLMHHQDKGTDIIDIRYQSDKEEYGKHFTAMIVFREV